MPLASHSSQWLRITRAQDRNYALAEGFHRMAKAANTWSLALRYQAQSERLYRRAVEDLERLMALRRELPNEPISAAQPEPTETSYTPAQTNPLPITPAPNRGVDDRFMSSARAAKRRNANHDSHPTRPVPGLVSLCRLCAPTGTPVDGYNLRAAAGRFWFSLCLRVSAVNLALDASSPRSPYGS